MRPWLSWVALGAVIAFAGHGVLHVEDPGWYAYDVDAVSARSAVIHHLAANGVATDPSAILAAAPATEPLLADAIAAALLRLGLSLAAALALTTIAALAAGLVAIHVALARRGISSTATLWLVTFAGALTEPTITFALPLLGLWLLARLRAPAAGVALALVLTSPLLVAHGPEPLLVARGAVIYAAVALAPHLHRWRPATAGFVLAGALLTARHLDRHDLLAPTYEIEQAAALSRVLPADAVVLTSGSSHHLIPTLTGRTTLPRSEGRAARAPAAVRLERERSRLFSARGDLDALVAQHHVTHIFVGPDETRRFPIVLDRLRARFPVVYTAEGVTVFDARPESSR